MNTDLREKIASYSHKVFDMWEAYDHTGKAPDGMPTYEQYIDQILSHFNQWLEEQGAQAPRFPAEDGLYWGPLRLDLPKEIKDATENK